MANLRAEVEGFLKADGFALQLVTDDLVTAERRGRDNALERRHVWVNTAEPGGKIDEAGLLATFAEVLARPAATGAAVPRPETQAFFLTPTLAGMSTEFRSKARDIGVGVRVPVQFFDTPYKADPDAAFGAGGAGEARSVFADFLARNVDVLARRVPQPYVALSSLGAAPGGFASGDDLLANLVAEVAAPRTTPRVSVIMGVAGAGKSVLFAALFKALTEHFTAEKRAQRPAPRPILFLPEHIRDRQVQTLSGLIGAVTETDAAAPTRPELMAWLTDHGHTIWMFDGLDEFFAGESDFVRALGQRLVRGSRAHIVICTRDSLLTSSTALRGFLDRHLSADPARSAVRIYELARWERPSQRALAWLRYTGRLPVDGAADPPPVARFLASLDESESAGELATLPFYCDLLIDIAGRPKAEQARDEFELLDLAIDALIDREAGKLASGNVGFDWGVFAGQEAGSEIGQLIDEWGPETFEAVADATRLREVIEAVGRARLVELIESIAHLMRCSEAYPGDGRGLTIGELEALAAMYADIGLDPRVEPRVLLAVVQFAFFAPGKEQGRLRFAHEIVADYLAARRALAMIHARPDSADALGQAVGVRRDLDRSIFLRALVRGIEGHPDVAAAVIGHVAAGRVRKAQAGNAKLLADALDAR